MFRLSTFLYPTTHIDAKARLLCRRPHSVDISGCPTIPPSGGAEKRCRNIREQASLRRGDGARFWDGIAVMANPRFPSPSIASNPQHARPCRPCRPLPPPNTLCHDQEISLVQPSCCVCHQARAWLCETSCCLRPSPRPQQQDPPAAAA